MDPEWAVGGNPIEAQLGLGEGVFDLPGALESFVGLEHVIGRLRARGARFLGVIEELNKALGAVLCAFDAGVETGLRHSLWHGVLTLRITGVGRGNQWESSSRDCRLRIRRGGCKLAAVQQ